MVLSKIFPRPKPLKFVKFITPLKHEEKLVRMLYNLEYFHVVEIESNTYLEKNKKFEKESEIASLSDRVKKLIDILNVSESEHVNEYYSEKLPSSDESIQAAKNLLAEYETKILNLTEQKQQLIKEKEKQLHLGKIQSLLFQMGLSLDDFFKSRRVKVFFGAADVFDDAKRWEISEVSDGNALIHAQLVKDNPLTNKPWMIIVIVLAQYTEQVLLKLRRIGFQEIELKTSTTPQPIEKIEKEIHEIDEKLVEIKKEIGLKLLAVHEMLVSWRKYLSTLMKFKRTKTQVVGWGWIPAEKFNHFKETLTSEFDDIIVSDLSNEVEFPPNEVPSYLPHNKFLNPINSLIVSYGVPNTQEIYPLRIMTVLFFILFGMMFADVGQGLMMVFAGIFLYFARTKKWYKSKKKLGFLNSDLGWTFLNGAELIVMMGISAIIFGFVFGSFLGDEEILRVYFYEGLLKHQFNLEIPGIPFELINLMGENEEGGSASIMIYLGIAITMGVFMISLGILMNLYKNLKLKQSHGHDDSHGHGPWGWLSPLFLLLIYWSMIGAVVTLFLNMINITYLLMGSFGVFFVLYFYSEWKHLGTDGLFFGFDHFLSLISHTFSFSRILALSLTHVILSSLGFVLIYKIAGIPLHVLRSEMTWLWIIVAILMSIIVVFLEGIIAFLHTLRLNWVEFFSKFYEGDGILFSPLKHELKYIKEG